MEERIKAFLSMVKEKKAIALAIAGILLVVVIGIVIFFVISKSGTEGKNGFSMFGDGGNAKETEYVSASGTTTLGYTMDEFEPDYIETDLYIEEVYLASGDEVEEGTPVFKVSEESIQEAREELEEKVKETDLDYRAGVITYEQSKISAKYDYDVAILEGQQAEAVYNSALADAEKKLKEAQDAVTEAEELIKEYTNAIENGGYYYEYDLDAYQKRYETNCNLYQQLLSEWGIKESELSVTVGVNESAFMLLSAPTADTAGDEAAGTGTSQEESGDAGTAETGTTADSNETGTPGDTTDNSTAEGSKETGTSGGTTETGSSGTTETGSSGSTTNSTTEQSKQEEEKQNEANGQQNVTESNKDREQKIKILQQLKKAVQTSESTYAKAWNEYEEATEKAATQLKKLNAQIESLRADLTEAETTYELEKLEAETTYKKALAQTELAESDYNAAMI